MASEEQQNRSLASKTAWPMLVLTAVLQVYSRRSSVAYVFMGVSSPVAGIGGRTAASMGGLQSVAAVGAFVSAARRDLRGTTLAVTGSMLLGWPSTLPPIVEQGLGLHGDDKVTPVCFILSPLLQQCLRGAMSTRLPPPSS